MPEDSHNFIIPGVNVIFYFEPLKVQRERDINMKSIQQKSGHTEWDCKYHIVWIQEEKAL